MKQLTIRLNEQGEKELERIKERYDLKKNAPAIEQALLLHLYQVDKIAELEKKVAEMQTIINYLEAK